MCKLPRSWVQKLGEYPNFWGGYGLPGSFGFPFFRGIFQLVILTCKVMTADTNMIPDGQPRFNDHYKDQLDQLPPSIKKKYGYALQPEKIIHYLSNRPVVSTQMLTPCSQRKSIDTTRKKIARSSRLKQILPPMVLVHYPD